MHGVVVNKTFKPLPGAHSVRRGWHLSTRSAREPNRRFVGKWFRARIFLAYEIGDEFERTGRAGGSAGVANAARRAQEKEAARHAELEERARMRWQKGRRETRLNARRLFRRQEMLPETEGF